MIQEIIRIPLEGAPNTRDLGGFLTEEGIKIRPRKLIRSGELSELSKKDMDTLTEIYKLSVIVDFRTEQERLERPDQKIEGVHYIHNPILKEAAMGITGEKLSKESVTKILHMIQQNESIGGEHMEKLYCNLVSNDFSRKQLSNFFHILLNHEEGAVLWHCTAGKDRVGTATALLLSVLGVSRECIVADYLKTNEFTAEITERVIKSTAEKFQDERLSQLIRLLFGVQESYIRTVFNKIEENYGTVEQYLAQEMQVGKEEAVQLRKKYLQY